jgi:hypothetical protein
VTLEFLHIAKCAGRALKYASNKMGAATPFRTLHKHSMKASDVLARNNTAIAVLRDPVSRFESAFTFVRTGGFGNRIPAEHLIGRYNSTDAFVEDLSAGSVMATKAARCDAKLLHCAKAPAVGHPFSLYRHATVEFKPQTWWLNVPPNPKVRIVCYEDLKVVLPSMKRKSNAQELKKQSLKGHWEVERDIQDEANKERVRRMYNEDNILYTEYCTK